MIYLAVITALALLLSYKNIWLVFGEFLCSSIFWFGIAVLIKTL